jgi:hypothetical protein
MRWVSLLLLSACGATTSAIDAGPPPCSAAAGIQLSNGQLSGSLAIACDLEGPIDATLCFQGRQGETGAWSEPFGCGGRSDTLRLSLVRSAAPTPPNTEYRAKASYSFDAKAQPEIVSPMTVTIP